MDSRISSKTFLIVLLGTWMFVMLILIMIFSYRGEPDVVQVPGEPEVVKGVVA